MATRKEQLEVGIVATDKASKVLGEVATQVEKLDGETASVDLTADDQASDEIKLLLDAVSRLDATDAEVVLNARADDFKREMANALKQIGRVKEQDHLDILIDAKNEAQAKFDAVQTAIGGLSTGATVTIGATDNATSVLEGVDNSLERGGDYYGMDAEVVINADNNASTVMETVDADRKALDGLDAEVALNADNNASTVMETVDTDRKALDGLTAEVVVTADTSQAAAGLAGVRTQAHGIRTALNGGGGGDQSKSIFANFAGNAAQELPGVATAFGPLSMAVSQFVEYSAEGNVNMRNMAKLAGPIAGLGLGFAILSENMKEAAATKAFNKEQVEDYADAIAEIGGGVQAVNLALRTTGEIVGRVPEDGILGGLLGKGETIDVSGKLADYGVTLEQLSSLIADTDQQVQVFWEGASGEGIMVTPRLIEFGEALQNAGLDASEVGQILEVLGENQTNYDNAVAASANTTQLFAHDLGSANTALDLFAAAADPVSEMPATWATLAHAIDDGTISTQAGVDAFNAIKAAFPEMSDADVFKVATGYLEDEAEATRDAAEATEEAATAIRDEYITALGEQNELLDETIDKLEEMADAQQSTGEAALDVRDAQRDAADAVENYNEVMADGKSTANEQSKALDGVVRAAADSADAQTDAANATAKANGRTMTQSQLLDHNNTALLNQANTLGGPMSDAILQYIADVNGIPNETVAAIRVALEHHDIDEANRLLQEASRTRKSYIQADIDRAAYNATEAQLKFLERYRTVPVRTVFTSFSEGQRGYAAGTVNARRGLHLVGEQGPELVEMAGGEKVHTTSATQAMLNPAPAGTVNNYYYAPAGYSNRGVTNATRRYARIQGPS